MATLIQIRRDTQANWTANNPILASGEIAFSTDQYKIKIGDGTSNWSTLAYMTATPTEITAQINAAVSGIVDSAPGVLDTLNEIAAAINDDPDFFTTVATNLSNHESDTTNVHGIADTSLLATTSYVDTAESDAITTANSYSDSLATNYDAAGSATTAESNANSYTDGEISTHNSDTTSVHGIADTSLLATTSYVDTAETDAVSAANSYSDSLASNYDPAGSASSAQSNAESYADSAVSTHSSDTTSVHGIADTSLLETATGAQSKADAAQSAAEATASTALSSHESDTTSVHGIADTSLLETATGAQSKADAAQSAAEATASTALSSHESDTTAVHGISNTANIVYTGDSRLSDSRTPTSHASTHESGGADEITIAQSQVTNLSSDLSSKIASTEKGAANGVATLDGNTKIPSSQLPAIAITSTYVVASESSMLALTVQEGDVAVRTDLNKSFILAGSDPTLISDWQELLSPTDLVQSVDGRTGTVSLSDLYDAAGSAATAESNANSYSDSLASNYDAAGSAASAQSSAESYADSAISTHSSDTTSVHGIADTSLLATTSYVDTAESDAVSTANAYSDSLASNYDSSGSAASAQTAAEGYADSAVSTHSSDTTSVHGIADTSLLATTSYVDTAESDAISSANSYSDGLATNYDPAGSASAVASDLTDHENTTTSVHGISDTADLVYTNDSRLSDSRTPTSHAASHESGGTDELTLSQSQITSLTTDLSEKSPLESPSFTGSVTLDSKVNIDTSTTTVSTTSATTVNTLSLSTYRSAEYLVQVTQGSKQTISKVVMIHDGTTASISEYAVIELGGTRIPLAISATVSGTDVLLQATITDADSTSATVEVIRTAIVL